MQNYDRSYFKNIFLREKGNSQRNRVRLKELLSYKENGELLEIGCGLGGFTRMAREHFNVACMDISAYAVRSLQEIPGVKATQADIETVILPENTFNVVVAFNVLEHLKNPTAVISKIKQSLVEGGILFGSVPNNHAVIGKTITKITDIVDRTHISTYPLLRWRSIFEASFGTAEFFGEVQLGKNHCIYTRLKGWELFSPNAVFVCTK